MVILNNNNSDQTLKTDRFSEIMGKYTSGKEIITENEISDLKNLKVPASSAMIIELK
jgi:hypothetical protein